VVNIILKKETLLVIKTFIKKVTFHFKILHFVLFYCFNLLFYSCWWCISAL